MEKSDKKKDKKKKQEEIMLEDNKPEEGEPKVKPKEIKKIAQKMIFMLT